MRLAPLLLLGLLATPALAQHGTVERREGRQVVVRLNEDITVLAPDIGDVIVPETQLTSAQIIVNAVDGDLAECTIISESSRAPQAGYPVRFDRPVQQGTLSVTSEPAGAAVSVDGARSGRTPALGLQLPAGTYRIELTHAGRAPDSSPVTVTVGQTTIHHRVLAPLTAAQQPEETAPGGMVQLVLTSTPGQARIFVDGQPMGFTPQEGLPPRAIELPAADTFAVEIRLEKHRPLFDTLTVAPGQVWEEHYALHEKRAPVSVLVYPWGSEVFLNDEPVGRTPYAGTLPWGYHTVRVERPGFVPLVQDSVFVWGMRSQRGSDMASIVESDLRRDAGWLRVRSGTPGLAVRLDGVAVGQTPLDLRVPSGRYELAIEEAGTQVHRETVTVDIQGEVTVTYGEPSPQGALLQESPPIASADGAPPSFSPPAPPLPSPTNAFLDRGLALTEAGDYEAARVALIEAQTLAPDDPDVSQAIAEVDRVLGIIRLLSPQETEDVAILRRRIREEYLMEDRENLERAAQRLFEYIPGDPATRSMLGWKGLRRSLTPGSGPSLELVYVFGTDDNPLGGPPPEGVESPPDEGFLLSATEVTNAHFATFLNQLGTERDAEGNPLLLPGPPVGLLESPRGWLPKLGLEDFPVLDATWYGARAYAAWAGGRLPTPDEWAWAFSLGLAAADEPPPANYHDPTDPTEPRPRPVGEFVPDGLGLFDMAGNVWEWAEAEAHSDDDGSRPVMGGSYLTPVSQATGVALSASTVANGSSQIGRQVGFRLLVPVE